MNYKMTLQYDGTAYNGWQKQHNTHNTIQELCENLLTKFSDTPVSVHASGRTDAGVHALAQTANFQLKNSYEPEQLKQTLNNLLPSDIAIDNISIVSDSFHSRLDAKDKTYSYKIYTNEVKNVFHRQYLYSITASLDIDAMIKAKEHLLGTHDFVAFTNNKDSKRSTIRTINQIDISYVDSIVQILINGNGFLYNMVRIIAGTLLLVGMNKLSADELPAIIDSKKRSMAGPLLPACGLTLVKVSY